jgi:hypothetical protein
MIRDDRTPKTPAKARKNQRKRGRFRMTRLESRIAPAPPNACYGAGKENGNSKWCG